MSIKESIQGDVVIITPKGNLMGEPETSDLRDKIKDLASQGFFKVVLDASKMKWVNSSGLGAMISALTSINNAGGDMRIANVTDKIQNLFMITQLIKVFKTFESIDRAVASYLVDPIKGKPVVEEQS